MIEFVSRVMCALLSVGLLLVALGYGFQKRVPALQPNRAFFRFSTAFESTKDFNLLHLSAWKDNQIDWLLPGPANVVDATTSSWYEFRLKDWHVGVHSFVTNEVPEMPEAKMYRVRGTIYNIIPSWRSIPNRVDIRLDSVEPVLD